jgi:hypothetical protein
VSGIPLQKVDNPFCKGEKPRCLAGEWRVNETFPSREENSKIVVRTSFLAISGLVNQHFFNSKILSSYFSIGILTGKIRTKSRADRNNFRQTVTQPRSTERSEIWGPDLLG